MSNSNQKASLGRKQEEQLRRIAEMRNTPQPPKHAIVLSAQVADALVPYVETALARGVTKTDLINLALASYFDVQVFEATT